SGDGRLDRPALFRDRLARHDLLPEHGRDHRRGYGRRVGAPVDLERQAAAPAAREDSESSGAAARPLPGERSYSSRYPNFSFAFFSTAGLGAFTGGNLSRQ